METDTNKKLKVALVHPEYRPDGGAERLLTDIIEILLQKKIHIVLITRKWGTDKENLSVAKCSSFYLGRVWKLLGFYLSARKKIAGLQVDLVQSQVHLPNCHIYYAGGGVHKEWLDRKNSISNTIKKKAVQFSLYHNLKKYLEKNTYCNRNLQAVICNSEMVKKEIIRNFDTPPHILHTIYPGIDFNVFNTKGKAVLKKQTRKLLGIPEERTVFIFAGSGFERKGLDMVITCFSQLPEDCELLVVGKDKNLHKYKRRTRRLNIEERVHFLGMQREMKPFYAAADVLVLPSLYDAFALVIIEAMACGLPVVASNTCGAAHDFIENGRNGYMCGPLDKEAFTRFMHDLRSVELRERIASNGIQTAQQFDLENMSRNFLRLYTKLIN